MRARLLSALLVLALVGIGAIAYLRNRPLVTLDRADDPATYLTILGKTPNDEFGHAVAPCGDQNGDGFDDFLVGAPYDDAGGEDAGTARLIDGQTGETIREWRGPGPGFQHGSDVVCFGGRIAIGVTSSGHVPGVAGGGVYIYDPKRAEPVLVIAGQSADDYFGAALADAGDVDADGTNDLIIGAPGSYKKNIAGSASVHSGADGTRLFILSGRRAIGDRFGFAVASAGDQNGDGHADLLVGAVGHDEHRGQVTLFDGAGGDVLRTWEGAEPGEELGHGVASVDDLDGDGRPELVLGAFVRNGVGYARVVSSGGKDRFVLRGREVGDGFAHSVAGIGDVDLDGHADIAVGAPDATIDGVKEVGYAAVFSGADGRTIHIVSGRRERGHFGYVVRAGGDIDQDGRADLLVGTVVVRGIGRAYALIGANLRR